MLTTGYFVPVVDTGTSDDSCSVLLVTEVTQLLSSSCSDFTDAYSLFFIPDAYSFCGDHSCLEDPFFADYSTGCGVIEWEILSESLTVLSGTGLG